MELLLTTVLWFDISQYHLRIAVMIFDTYGNFAFNVYDTVGLASEKHQAYRKFHPKCSGRFCPNLEAESTYAT